MSNEVNLTCLEAHCYPDTGCKIGEELGTCPHLQKKAAEESEMPLKFPDGNGVPWTGSAFGIDDIAWLASRQRPLLYAPIGAHNVGKTTFLASLYIGLCRGILPASHQFAGSFTFGGWEKLAAYIRLAPDGIGPCFPPHTPVTNSRLPGWLHLGLKGDDEQLRDVLLADAPGEWFSRWALHPTGDGAEGARWVAHHADGFLLFVDSAGLAGDDRRNVAENTETLARRVATAAGNRPVAIVWAKSDEKVRPQLRSDVEESLKKALPMAMTFQTSVQPEPSDLEPTIAFWKPLEWLLSKGQAAHPQPVADTVEPSDPFLAFRG